MNNQEWRVVSGQAEEVEQQYGSEGRDECGRRGGGRGPRRSDGSAIRQRTHETTHPEWTVSYPGGARRITET